MAKFWLHMFYDHNPVNPRKSETLGNMVCWNEKYNLGDKHSFKNEKDFFEILMRREGIDPKDFDMNDFEASKESILKRLRKAIPIIPIYLYDGKYPELTSADERAGKKGELVGYLYMGSDELKNEYGWDDRDCAIKGLYALLEELDKYSHYVSGENYRLQILKDGEEIENISGFTGNIYDDVLPEMKKAAYESLGKEGISSEQVNDMFGVDAPQIISEKNYGSVPNIESVEYEEMEM